MYNGVSLRRIYESNGAARTCHLLGESIEQGDLSAEDFSVRELAEVFIGRQWVDNLIPNRTHSGYRPIQTSGLLEAGDAVSVTAFSNITGQLLITRLMEGFKGTNFLADRLTRTVPTRLDGEKIPGMGRLDSEGESVHEGMPFPRVGFGEDYIETPSTTKYGHIVPVTKEAIFFDRTGILLDEARRVGERLALRKEKAILDLVIGATNNFKWKGTSYNTYVSTPWDNTATGVTLTDWTDLETLMLMFTDLTDPDTGDPILINPTQLLVMPAKKMTARRILNATEIRVGDITTGTGTQTVSANPVAGEFEILSSPLFDQRVIAASGDDDWMFLGDFKQAFWYMENWPITMVQAPPQSDAEFDRDIVAQFKASERGVPAVVQPRAVLKSINS